MKENITEKRMGIDEAAEHLGVKSSAISGRIKKTKIYLPTE